MASSSLPKTYKVLRALGLGKEPEFQELPLPKPGKNQVLVKIEYAPINPTDLFAMQGLYGEMAPLPYSVGMEGAGTIVAIGEDLTVPHKVGDKVHVFGISGTGQFCAGAIGEYFLSDAETCTTVEGDISLQEAASHFVNPVTAYYMAVLAEQGNHKAVIHTAASSALGRMLIRLFKQRGIKLINIVRNDKYIEELKKEGADYVLNLNAPDFEKELKEIIAKENVTLAYDAISGEFITKLISYMPRRSTTMVYGALSNDFNVTSNLWQLAQRKYVTGLMVSDYIEDLHNAGKLNETLKEIHRLLPTVLKSNIIKEFSLNDFKEALAYYNENSAKGKIILKIN